MSAEGVRSQGVQDDAERVQEPRAVRPRRPALLPRRLQEGQPAQNHEALGREGSVQFEQVSKERPITVM